MSKRSRAAHSRNSVRWYLLIAALLLFFFFSNDFGLIDIQKTALVMAVGIDRDEEGFVVTAQIAVPQSSAQGKEAQAVQLESRGETVGDALEQINVKTGWYPKLVFCNLIVLGEEAVRRNVFDALDFFLRDEYMSDGCLVAACEGSAGDLLDTATPIDPISSVAAQKVLSRHASKVATVVSVTLREFAIGYFSASRSGWLPVLKAESLQESSGGNGGNGSGEEQGQGSDQGQNQEQNAGAFTPTAAAGEESGSGSGSDKSGSGGGGTEQTFSAAQTLLFSEGVGRGILTPEETFAFCIANGGLRLATYTTESNGAAYTLNIKKSRASVKFRVDKNGVPRLVIRVKASAGLESTAFSQTVPEISDTHPLPEEVLTDAENALSAQILEVFEKSRADGCDLFEVTEKLRKFENDYYSAYRDDILGRVLPQVEVKISALR